MTLRTVAPLLLAHATASAFIGRAPMATQRRAAVSMATIGSGKAAAEEQQKEYFEMLPWEVPTRIELPGGIKSSLDLRAFIQPFNRSGAVMTGVFVVQEGVPRGAYPQARKNAKVGWRPIGLVAALDEASLPMACARQRGLIAAWANEYVRDYATDEKVFDLSPGAPPVRIAYGERPSPTSWGWISDRTWEGDLTEVPLDLEDDGVSRCGFFGSQSRSQMGRLKDGSQSGFRYVGIELPEA